AGALGEDHERRPEERVGSRREYPQLFGARLMVVRSSLEDDLAAFRPADPVRLLDADRVGEVDLAEVEELVGVLRDPQVPLRQVALLDLRAAPPAVPVGALDLLAGERSVIGTPVDGRGRAGNGAGL